jgi:phosphoribosylformylglycinamidine synthase
MVFPGGFSYGDDVSAAVLWAKELKYRLGGKVRRFVEEGKPVLGICNGFQVLVKAGLLPAFSGLMERQEATLAFNDIGLYYDGWVYLKHEPRCHCIFTEGLNDVVYLPVAHAEGKFVINQEGLEELWDSQQVVLRYVNQNGEFDGFPYNPNGSVDDIAGICNREGNVFGLMPHPERSLHVYMHPRWTGNAANKEGDGLHIFRKAVGYAEKF